MDTQATIEELTEKTTEQRTYDFIVEFIKENGYSPTVREIASGMGFSSTNTPHYHKERLAAKGKITFVPGIGRSIVVRK